MQGTSIIRMKTKNIYWFHHHQPPHHGQYHHSAITAYIITILPSPSALRAQHVLSLASTAGWTVKKIPDNDACLCGDSGATNTVRWWLHKPPVFPVSVPRLIGPHIKEGNNACKKVATDRKWKMIMAGTISLMTWQRGKIYTLPRDAGLEN